ncbi:SIP domain-containing protein [Deinococcus petrolearius]|uniref:SIP domain-containing protein n=1 Tax=Deinococcus petrolearius TaxID=1751295 RepID=A0ABW1DQY4_9DEIO
MRPARSGRGAWGRATACGCAAGGPSAFPSSGPARCCWATRRRCRPSPRCWRAGRASRDPRVLLEIRDAAEQRYLDGVGLPAGTHLSWLPAGETPGSSLLRAVQGLERVPGSVWGALEVDAARTLRAAVRDDLGVARGASVVMGYWHGPA